MIVGHERIKDIIEANSGPFFVNISKRTGTHLARLRYPRDYEKPQEPELELKEDQTLPEAPFTVAVVEVQTSEAQADLSKAKPGKLFT